jgi:hypothetical protein
MGSIPSLSAPQLEQLKFTIMSMSGVFYAILSLRCLASLTCICSTNSVIYLMSELPSTRNRACVSLVVTRAGLSFAFFLFSYIFLTAYSSARVKSLNLTSFPLIGRTY